VVIVVFGVLDDIVVLLSSSFVIVFLNIVLCLFLVFLSMVDCFVAVIAVVPFLTGWWLSLLLVLLRIVIVVVP
jgi:hypothetical protein